MNEDAAKILLVDDEQNVLKALSRILRDYHLVTAQSGEESLLLAKEIEFDLVISDYRMPGMDGVEFLKKFIKLQPNAMRMILTGYADLESAQHAINEAGVFRFLNKPWNNLEIINAVAVALEHKRILQENKDLADQVRRQQALLKDQDAILRALEAEEPGITKVNWAADGSIIINEDEYE
ncbi:response regulator [Methylotuvimicrobium buryatense]|uniref:Response regulator n=1 Tax=Methylotuvimicrobium buryatense TaxID=95641 RepID=A0A4P9UPW0_METBY|nr:response regulator [Methylotuvimicrobium buryatense]QCW83398.1 response regulator [Methylotuvimicrobium buryatense]